MTSGQPHQIFRVTALKFLSFGRVMNLMGPRRPRIYLFITFP